MNNAETVDYLAGKGASVPARNELQTTLDYVRDVPPTKLKITRSNKAPQSTLAVTCQVPTTARPILPHHSELVRHSG